MIDRIRADIEQRLEQVLAEADRLREALNALGTSDGPGAAPARRQSRGPARGGRRGGSARSGAAAGGRASRGRSTRSRAATGRSTGAASAGGGGAAASGRTRTRTASGATRQAVLDALSKAGGQPLTAGQVASATGLGRPSVSTTLSKLARSGDVTKAQRGYSLGSSAGGASSGSA